MILSVVTTTYNSSNFIALFVENINNTLKNINVETFEVIIVDDGSQDDSVEKCKALKEKFCYLKIVEFSKNFGHHQALYAGLKLSKGSFVFLIDSDLEEDPELLYEYWKRIIAQPQYDVVYGVQSKRKGGFFERLSGQLFYKILNCLIDFKYPFNTLTARLMTRNYVDAILNYNEKTLELWSIFSVSGFNNLEVISQKTDKKSTSYTVKKKIGLAVETITSSSVRPLNLIVVVGFLIFLLSVLMVVENIYKRIYYGENAIQGYSSLMVSIWFLGGITVMTLGVIGIYISKIFLEVKNRPLYHIKNIY